MNSATASAAVEEPHLSDETIYERLVAAILDQRLPPGTKLVSDRLAQAFGVSRTRIHPVLVRLANERIVTFTPRRGASVAQPSVEEAREVFEVRRMIEPRLVALFIANASGAAVQGLADCIAQEEAAHAAGDTVRAVRLTGEFHLLIAEGSGHQTLGRVLRELVFRTSLIIMRYGTGGALQAGSPACACLDHRRLLDAIRLGDANEAARFMREHLEQIESQLHFTQRPAGPPDLASLFGRVTTTS
ncbi:GntR family transcriptional regulator [Xylophilus sp. GOD-11R]|uniref:GntR family transcriptional regulator n=1 Tax=Xylophilus sp. GOD-11R TaxID=3089814 RepID=UPI00298CAC65|nr:GntR family transcriptional regulator [Xylophilus sp. GOD-11R]WPB57850.1 GntR family transcriptional regulator [Xylophilus sp. GOD-11R]